MTCFHWVTHIKSDTRSHLSILFPVGLWHGGLYLWAHVVACELFRSSFARTNSAIHLSSELLCNGAVAQCPAADRCGAVWCCVVGDICSTPPAKSPHHMVLFMHMPFSYPGKGPETHKHCPNDNKGSTITGNTLTTNPALSPQWLCCMRTRIGG